MRRCIFSERPGRAFRTFRRASFNVNRRLRLAFVLGAFLAMKRDKYPEGDSRHPSADYAPQVDI